MIYVNFSNTNFVKQPGLKQPFYTCSIVNKFDLSLLKIDLKCVLDKDQYTGHRTSASNRQTERPTATITALVKLPT